MTTANIDKIRTFTQDLCLLCNTQGIYLYKDLDDRIYNLPGKWSLKYCPKNKCGLIWLDSMPMPEDMNIMYNSYYTHEYIDKRLSVIKSLYDIARKGYLQHKYGYQQGVGPKWYRLLSFIALLHPLGTYHAQASVMFLSAPKSNNRLLDVGCGNGNMLIFMNKLGWDVEGVETDPVAYKIASKNYKKVYFSELASREYSANYFDSIYLNHVIEHVHNPILLIKECYRILKPGGQMVILTPNTLSYGHKYFKESWLGLDPPRHLYLFNTKNIKNIIKSAGFNLKNIQVSSRVTDALAISREMQKGKSSKYLQQRMISQRRNTHSVILSLWERLSLIFDDSAGEELVLIAGK